MSKFPEPYRLADIVWQDMSRYITSRMNKAKGKLSVLKFDELNVMEEIDALYADISKDCSGEFKALYKARYAELFRFMEGFYPSTDVIDELAKMYLAGLWNIPNENTHYAFTAELIRKRDRAKEAVVSVPTKAQKQLELEKAMRFVAQQIGFYVDFVSQDAELQVYKDLDIERVKRHELDDDRVCVACKRLDGEVYNIDKIPPLPHLRCRRWFEPVI